jgi:hypothetical protein
MSTGWDILDFFNFALIFVYSIPFTLCLAGILLTGICCGPCIYIFVRNYMRQRDSQSQNHTEFANKVIGGLVHKKFEPSAFKGMNECAICALEYTEDDDITPLPCNVSHYYHT